MKGREPSNGIALGSPCGLWAAAEALGGFPRLDHGLPNLHAAPSLCSHALEGWPSSPDSLCGREQPQCRPRLWGRGRGSSRRSRPPLALGSASSPHRATLTGASDRSLLWTGVSTLISVCVTSPACFGPCLHQPIIRRALET